MDFDISLDADSNLQRGLAQLIRSQKPVKLTMISGREYSGWVSGLDEDSIQLCLVDTLNRVWVLRSQIESLCEHRPAPSLTKYAQEELDGYTKRMVANATKALEKK